MKKVYVLTTGEYSDRSIEGIFSTKDLAREYIDTIPRDNYNDLEGFVVDPPEPLMIKNGYRVWDIVMENDGGLTCVDTADPSYYDLDMIGVRIYNNVVYALIWARNEEHAIEIVNEKRIQMLANGELKKEN